MTGVQTCALPISFEGDSLWSGDLGTGVRAGEPGQLAEAIERKARMAAAAKAAAGSGASGSGSHGPANAGGHH